MNLGGNLALAICLEAAGERDSWAAGTEPAPDGWAAEFLAACNRLAEAEIVLGHCESGFMRLEEGEPGEFRAWIASKRQPAVWRERLDFDWWATWSRERHQDDIRAVTVGASASRPESAYRELAAVHVKTMAYQFGYPPGTDIAGTDVGIYTGVLERLIAWALHERHQGVDPEPQPELALAERLAAELPVDAIALLDVLAAFTLDRENAAYHSAVPGIAPAPLVRVGPDSLVWSLSGLLAEPLLFLTRELKRRNPEAYHNAAIQREAVFREDIYALFADKRFLLAPRRIELRRDKGDLRTDIDALVFDRKTGTLGLFELKSQDPFVRSHAELMRQRDNVLYANRQVSGVLGLDQAARSQRARCPGRRPHRQDLQSAPGLSVRARALPRPLQRRGGTGQAGGLGHLAAGAAPPPAAANPGDRFQPDRLPLLAAHQGHAADPDDHRRPKPVDRDRIDPADGLSELRGLPGPDRRRLAERNK